jgi:hypothetical protein
MDGVVRRRRSLLLGCVLLLVGLPAPAFAQMDHGDHGMHPPSPAPPPPAVQPAPPGDDGESQNQHHQGHQRVPYPTGPGNLCGRDDLQYAFVPCQRTLIVDACERIRNRVDRHHRAHQRAERRMARAQARSTRALQVRLERAARAPAARRAALRREAWRRYRQARQAARRDLRRSRTAADRALARARRGFNAALREVLRSLPRSGSIATPCAFSHRKSDDPIVFPAQPGASHSHDFFGNRSTDAFSTVDTLLASPATSCRRRGDTAAYWAPTLYRDGRAVRPITSQIFFERGGGRLRGSLRSFPAGLRIIAGDPRSQQPQSRTVTEWDCDPALDFPAGSTVPTCPTNRLVLRFKFPDCWDGFATDSSDHKSHMAYRTGVACPPSHPVPVPRVVFNIHYPINGGPGITLASGGPTTAHADFFNAWDPAELRRLVDACLNTPGARVCRPPR